LPELNHDAQPGLNQSEREGRSEDFFTNRDVIHAAISADDGRTWRGFRELYLNDRRNDADFRTTGGNAESLDKSIHQSWNCPRERSFSPSANIRCAAG
jgi:hypothetical protein